MKLYLATYTSHIQENCHIIWCLNGECEKSKLTPGQITLPVWHLVKLLIKPTHLRKNIYFQLSELRQRYWILNTRGMIKKSNKDFLNYGIEKSIALSKEITSYMRAILTMVTFTNTSVKLCWESLLNAEAVKEVASVSA